MASIAVLDDYQGVALQMADWSGLAKAHTIRVFRVPFVSEAEAAKELADFEIVCAMRERTLLHGTLLRQLPKLKLLVTTGMRNAAIDMEAAKAQGIMVCGTASGDHATAELAFGLMLNLARLNRRKINSDEG